MPEFLLKLKNGDHIFLDFQGCLPAEIFINKLINLIFLRDSFYCQKTFLIYRMPTGYGVKLALETFDIHVFDLVLHNIIKVNAVILILRDCCQYNFNELGPISLEQFSEFWHFVKRI